MGERDHDRDQPTSQPTTGRRVTVREAAAELGITVEAVRNRIKRGTLASEKEGDKERGTVYVILDGDQLPPGQPGAGRSWTGGHPQGQPEPADQPAELVEELRDRIAYLERQVEQEREARRRADTLMARLMDRVPELPAASNDEPPDARESAATEAEGVQAPPPPRGRRQAYIAPGGVGSSAGRSNGQEKAWIRTIS